MLRGESVTGVDDAAREDHDLDGLAGGTEMRAHHRGIPLKRLQLRLGCFYRPKAIFCIYLL